MRTGLVEPIEHQENFLSIFGIWVSIVKGIEQRMIFRPQLLLQLIYSLKQLFSFLVVFLLNGLNHRITKTVDLAIRPKFSLIAANDLYNIFRKRFYLGSISLLPVRRQRKHCNKQEANDQQPIHNGAETF